MIGLGRAGRARLRAIKSLGLSLSAVASARPEEARASLEAFGFSEATRVYRDWRELLKDPEVKVTLICSENQVHEAQARASLLENHHVCVEFPLVSTSDAARSLWTLADERNRVLHVEVIGTLTARHLLTREWLKMSEAQPHQARPHRWRSTLNAGAYRWVSEALSAGEVMILAFGRVYQALSLFGPLVRSAVQLELETGSSEPSSSLELTFESRDGITVEIVERRESGLRRASQSALYDERGQEITLEQMRADMEQAGLIENANVQGEQTPLFEADLCHFLGLISQLDPRLAHLSEHPAVSCVSGYAQQDLLLAAQELCDADPS